MSEPLTLRVKNAVDAIRPASVAVLAWLEANNIGPAPSLLANLAVEELVTNCIKYGYADTRDHVIEIDMSITDGQLVLHVVDDGKAFNPVEAPAPDTSEAPESRAIGGLGLHLLRTLSDGMSYERRGGFNHVTLVKRLD